MVAFCTKGDVEKRLSRELTSDEEEWLAGKIEEAQALVVGYLGCGEEPYEAVEDVPGAVRIVTSRMVARVYQEAATITSDTYGTTQVGQTAGPFSQQVSFAPGSRLGSPWMTNADRESLSPYRCGGKAFSVNTAPSGGGVHAEACSALNYNVPGAYWQAYCTCGADLAGHPIYGND